MIPEAELIEQWRPHGIMPITADPVLRIIDGQIVATCATPGASIGWTTDPPQANQTPPAFTRITGDPQTGGRHWQLYFQPLKLPTGTTIWFRAQRLGYRASGDQQIIIG